jgi:hypothetical protein
MFKPLTRALRSLVMRCDSCGGQINPQTGECRCSD